MVQAVVGADAVAKVAKPCGTPLWETDTLATALLSLAVPVRVMKPGMVDLTMLRLAGLVTTTVGARVSMMREVFAGSWMTMVAVVVVPSLAPVEGALSFRLKVSLGSVKLSERAVRAMVFTISSGRSSITHVTKPWAVLRIASRWRFFLVTIFVSLTTDVVFLSTCINLQKFLL